MARQVGKELRAFPVDVTKMLHCVWRGQARSGSAKTTSNPTTTACISNMRVSKSTRTVRGQGHCPIALMLALVDIDDDDRPHFLFARA